VGLLVSIFRVHSSSRSRKKAVASIYIVHGGSWTWPFAHFFPSQLVCAPLKFTCLVEFNNWSTSIRYLDWMYERDVFDLGLPVWNERHPENKQDVISWSDLRMSPIQCMAEGTSRQIQAKAATCRLGLAAPPARVTYGVPSPWT
jgi:hypothetical protein